MDIVWEIKKFVEEECKKPSSKYGYDPFPFHFVPMVKYAEKLADELGWDKEVILLAARLHDIGAIINGRENHHLTGADIVEMKLKEFDYPIAKIELIKQCILHHRGSQNFTRETLEEQIIAEADTISNIDNIAWLFKVALVYEGKTQWEAKDSVRQKLERKWTWLHFESSRKIVQSKYDAAMLLLG